MCPPSTVLCIMQVMCCHSSWSLPPQRAAHLQKPGACHIALPTVEADIFHRSVPATWSQGVPCLPQLQVLRLSGMHNLARYQVATAGSAAANGLLQLTSLECAVLSGCQGLEAVPASFGALAALCGMTAAVVPGEDGESSALVLPAGAQACWG